MKTRIIFGFVLALSILFFLSVSFGNQAEKNRSILQTPVAVLPSESYQFEPVPDGMEVRHDFVIQNAGEAQLLINRVKTG